MDVTDAACTSAVLTVDNWSENHRHGTANGLQSLSPTIFFSYIAYGNSRKEIKEVWVWKVNQWTLAKSIWANQHIEENSNSKCLIFTQSFNVSELTCSVKTGWYEKIVVLFKLLSQIFLCSLQVFGRHIHIVCDPLQYVGRAFESQYCIVALCLSLDLFILINICAHILKVTVGYWSCATV